MQSSALFAMLALTSLAACSSADEPVAEETPAAVPTPVLTSTPTPTVAPDGSPLALGAWTINESGTGASASFGPEGGDALLLVTCDAASKTLSLAISNATPGNQSFVVESGGTAARLDMVADGNAALPRQVAQIAIDAPVFGGFVVPGGTIEISQPGGATLRVPSAAGIRRIFEACR
jgi:hypothetical protein